MWRSPRAEVAGNTHSNSRKTGVMRMEIGRPRRTREQVRIRTKRYNSGYTVLELAELCRSRCKLRFSDEFPAFFWRYGLDGSHGSPTIVFFWRSHNDPPETGGSDHPCRPGRW